MHSIEAFGIRRKGNRRRRPSKRRAVSRGLPPLMAASDHHWDRRISTTGLRSGRVLTFSLATAAAPHNPAYDFNDEALPYGVGSLVKLVETALSVKGLTLDC